MGLFSSQSTDLARIANALEFLVNHIVKGTPGSLRTVDADYKEDGSAVSYVDDARQFIRESERLEYFNRTGIMLREDEDVPRPVDEKGKEWQPPTPRS